MWIGTSNCLSSIVAALPVAALSVKLALSINAPLFLHFQDEHLFTLEKFVKGKIVARNLCLATLMGEKPVEPAHVHNEPAQMAHSDDEDSGSKTMAFTAGVNHKKLRCLKV